MVDERPAMRALEVQRIDGPPGPGVVLVDRLRVSEPTFLPDAAVPIAGRCTGELTIEEIHREAQAHYADGLSLDDVRGLVRQLDERLLLVGPRFDAAVAQCADEFLAGGVRPASHAGSDGYPRDPDELRRALDALLGDRAPATRAQRGLIAPHIDLARGAEGYAAAYRELIAAGPADLYVVFGTAHAGAARPLTGLELDWRTPLGTTATDRAFVDAVHAHIGRPVPQDVLIHRDEHSLEFQVLWLQHVHQRHFGDRDFRVAGFLCGHLPSLDGDPLREPWLRDVLAAFRKAEATAGGTVRYIAGADLAHVGPFFGDAQPLDDARLRALAEDERKRLGLLERAEPGAFHRAVARGGNPDRVCSAPAITLVAALAGGRGELHHYAQARAADDSQAVTFCAMSFAGSL